MSDELLDIVNEDDEVIGQKLRSEIYNKKLTNFRVVNAFIQNDQGQLWIPRRSSYKRLFPLCLDASMGGHVSAGESYQEALRREIMEELRIDLDCVACEELGFLTPQKHGVSAFMKVFLIKTNETPNYNADDFIEFFWYMPQEIIMCLKNGDKSKSDLPKMIHYFFN